MARVIYGEFVNGKIQMHDELADIEWAKAVIVLTEERKRSSISGEGQLQFGKYSNSPKPFSTLDDFKTDRWDADRDTLYGD
jgi:hypothetical protein